MDDWDAEDFEPTLPETKGDTDKWEGEDEDEALKDNWDDEDEEEKKAKKAAEKAKAKAAEKPKEVKKGGKKYLQQKLKEKEAERIKAAEERRIMEENKTEEEKMADRLLAQKLSEESELEIMKGQFSMEEINPEKLTLDTFEPRTKEDFTKYAKMLQDKLTTLENSPHYFYLLETVLSSAVIKLESEDLKKLSLPITALANEKLKMEKQQKKGTKKPAKAKLGGAAKSSRNDMLEDYSQYDDFDDFM